MEWKLNSDRPVYLQLIENLEFAIISGEYAPGDKIQSVRDLAVAAAVNPNTMQRALQELEIKGLINTQRTSGRTITSDTGIIESIRKKKASEQIEHFVEDMGKLGYSRSDILDQLEKKMEESK